MSGIFQQLDPVLKQIHFDQFFDEIKPLKNIAEKIGSDCRPSHIVFFGICCLIVLPLFFWNLGIALLTQIIGFAYPAYMSFKALESKQSRDDKQWLTYWIIVSFITVFDGVIHFILSFIPLYHFFKIAFYVYLFHPKTKGAEQIYNSFLEGLLTKYESTIDDLIQKAEGKINKNIETTKAKFQ